jgi:hypothetical protein
VDEVEREGEVEDVRGAPDEVVERGDAGVVQSAIWAVWGGEQRSEGDGWGSESRGRAPRCERGVMERQRQS